jgi:hypothetical protein
MVPLFQILLAAWANSNNSQIACHSHFILDIVVFQRHAPKAGNSLFFYKEAVGSLPLEGTKRDNQ